MALNRNTDLGKITIHDKVFENIIADSCQKPSVYDKIWLAQRPNIKAAYDEEGNLELSFSVYVKFGRSIREISGELADIVRESIKVRTGDNVKTIYINVAAVRANNLVRRNMNIEIIYSDDGVIENILQ